MQGTYYRLNNRVSSHRSMSPNSLKGQIAETLFWRQGESI
jgi:hypothetical protein